ncbi:MAG: hypothetical protein SFU21_06635 [Flavihumibacter sp.]|nr:hypothetical protein [Flavihumibacter sp.]
MGQAEKIIRSGSLLLLIIIAVYLVINCIVAIPLMDENNSKNKEIYISLKEELKTIKSAFVSHLNDFQFDSTTLVKYDKITSGLGAASSSASLKNYLQLRLQSFKRTVDNASDLFLYKFNYENQNPNFKLSEWKKNFIIQQYKKNCDSAENELTNTHMGTIGEINRLYAIFIADTSKGFTITKQEYTKLNRSLFFMPLKIDFGKELDSSIVRIFCLKQQNRSLGILYSLSNDLIEMNSSSIVIILGMLGVGFFGAIISLIRKNEDVNKLEMVSNQIFFLIVSSLATSVITYLSLQGGITLITLGNDVTLNPYFILFVCFAASVFSEQIWEKVKNWIK